MTYEGVIVRAHDRDAKQCVHCDTYSEAWRLTCAKCERMLDCIHCKIRRPDPRTVYCFGCLVAISHLTPERAERYLEQTKSSDLNAPLGTNEELHSRWDRLQGRYELLSERLDDPDLSDTEFFAVLDKLEELGDQQDAILDTIFLDLRLDEIELFPEDVWQATVSEDEERTFVRTRMSSPKGREPELTSATTSHREGECESCGHQNEALAARCRRCGQLLPRLKRRTVENSDGVWVDASPPQNEILHCKRCKEATEHRWNPAIGRGLRAWTCIPCAEKKTGVSPERPPAWKIPPSQEATPPREVVGSPRATQRRLRTWSWSRVALLMSGVVVAVLVGLSIAGPDTPGPADMGPPDERGYPDTLPASSLTECDAREGYWDNVSESCLEYDYWPESHEKHFPNARTPQLCTAVKGSWDSELDRCYP